MNILFYLFIFSDPKDICKSIVILIYTGEYNKKYVDKFF